VADGQPADGQASADPGAAVAVALGPEGEGERRCPVVSVPVPDLPLAAVDPPPAPAPAPVTPAGVTAVTAAWSAPAAREPVGTWAFTGTTEAVGGVLDTWGHPWNPTTALASTNIRAAPASNMPEVPKPATYARVAPI
jgi:hypothetical protein